MGKPKKVSGKWGQDLLFDGTLSLVHRIRVKFIDVLLACQGSVEEFVVG